MTQEPQAHMQSWLSEPLPKNVEQALDRLCRSYDVQYVAVMPDVHLSEDICIGTVLATTHVLYPDAVGGDIGCGVSSVQIGGDAMQLADERIAAKLLHGLSRFVPAIRRGSHMEAATPPDCITAMALSDFRLERLKARQAMAQLGTLGRGNHFLEFQRDSDERLWLTVHSGSRMMGQAIRDHHLKGTLHTTTGLRYLEAVSTSGEAYRRDMGWALIYAEANRRAIIQTAVCLVEEMLGVTADWATYLSCTHNHVRQERHFGAEWWVHRKGAIMAQAGVEGIIPGSMGTASYHVEGRGHATSLCSSSHGAGRVLSRGEAHRVIRAEQFRREMRGIWFDQRHLSQLRDEAPSAYKDITHVMRAQRELTKIIRVLRPVLNYKALT